MLGCRPNCRPPGDSMRTHSLLAAAALLLLPAAATAGPASPGPVSGGRTGYIVGGPEKFSQPYGAEVAKIIFLNRCVGGCTFTPGPDNALENVSGIVDETTFLSEWTHGDTAWQELLTCLNGIYEPFDVVFTDVDPTPEFHHEAVVAGSNVEFGNVNILGVALISGDCAARNNAISFTLANSDSFSTNVQYMCETVAQETAHAFGLDHEFDCHDPMTYLPGCSPKYFRNEAYQCGTFSAEQCFCGGTHQNSHLKLMNVFGAGAGVAPPTVDIALPEDGAVVDSEFTVYAIAADIRGNKFAELRINGYKWMTVDPDDIFNQENTYRFTTPANLPDGYQNIEVRAYNDLEVTGSATIQVLKGSPCASADACLDGQFCSDGACAWPPPTGVLGDACVRNQDCISDLCPAIGDERVCSQECLVGVSDQCPETYECLEAGDTGICWPADQGGGGCCSLGGQRTGWIQLLLFGAVILLVSIRRRRP